MSKKSNKLSKFKSAKQFSNVKNIRKVGSDSMTKKYYILSFFVTLLIILIFAGLDYLIHSLSNEYSVPSYYFRNKIIFGTLIGYLSYLLFQKRSVFVKSLLVSLLVSVLLQVRYFIEGYPLDFVLLFLFVHFIILLPVSFVVFKISTKVL